MKTAYSISQLRAEREKLANPVGFVPTMGFLHEGHLSLVQAAQKECASVVISIFVNPSQFGPEEDFEAYPRDIPRDCALLAGEGVDLVWLPDRDEMYPDHFQTWIEVVDVSQPLEGALRPGHFRGVATIVAKLFNAVMAQRAYFGQKDAQQVVVIKQMVRDLNFPTEVVVCPTMRESDGLAMSSRNSYLSVEERKAATVLYRSLSAAQEAYASGDREAKRLREIMRDVVQSEPMAQLEYVSCADPLDLRELTGPVSSALLSMAVKIGSTRLIDNIVIG